ncbi:unnamed protein product [Medioppia subpectinata]|uniref:Peptidase M3A/M3B catalytic domain-containing protein n=1 Tax=Medioppia subpectinata TaxID=1979941 RepID=A0A7R9L0E6_9ACAR|nr:unnamed protein product [Medioppia subpectinata]CAG2113308.1 unnamed protein product [Medioppia subpectinata]
MSTNTGAIVGSFYFDPYCRLNHKTSTSYNELALNQYNSLSTKSVSYLITNFAEPVIDGQSTQLSFSQIISLFKQFGHIMHQSLSASTYAEISGVSGAEWDVANFFPQFFALWPLNSYAVIASCSRHVANGSPLPESEFDKIRRAHYHFASFDLKHEIYRMALDLALYSSGNFWSDIRDQHEIYRMALDLALYSSGNFWSDIRDQVWDEYMTPFVRDRLDKHPCSFRAIFSDDLAAAYFSTKWAEMLAADAFGAFQVADVDNDKAVAQVGARFTDSFLTNSADYKSSEVFRRFLGRDPSPDAYLRINGLYGKDSYAKRDTLLANERTVIDTSAEKHAN